MPPGSIEHDRELPAASSRVSHDHQKPEQLPSPLDGKDDDSTGPAEGKPLEKRPQSLLPQCPFSGFPLPPLPRVLRGHYLTDQSDLGLTDAEGGEGGDGSRRNPHNCESERRLPQVAAAEEYFLSCCLSFIKKRSSWLLMGLALQQQESLHGGSPQGEFSPDGCCDPEGPWSCSPTKAAVLGGGEGEAGADLPPAVPPLPQLSEAAFCFQRRLPTAAQRLFYTTFLSEFPLAQPPSASCDEAQERQCSPTTPTDEQQSSTQDEPEEQQQHLPLLTDLLDAILMCTSSSSSKKDSPNSPLSEASLRLSQGFSRRLRRGGSGKPLDMAEFLLLLAKSNPIVRYAVFCPIRALARTFPQYCAEVEGPPQAVTVEASTAAADATSLENFVKELMLPALPAHARNAKPPRMAAVAVGVLLMETLERLCAAVPPVAAGEPLHKRAAAVDALILQNLASSQFVSAFGSGSAAQAVAARQREEGDVPEPLQHEQLCWLCRGEGDLLLCDGLPRSASSPPARSEVSNPSSSVTVSAAAAPRPCRHVFHIGCAFPPPTPAELQPNAHWSCPLCKARDFQERRYARQQQQRKERQHQQPDQVHQQECECQVHEHQQHDEGREQLAQQERGQHQQNEGDDIECVGGTLRGEAASQDLLEQIFRSVDRLAQQETGERTLRQSQLQLASCEELQLAALKRLFVDKARGLLARTRQLCKRLDALHSKRQRLWVAARRRKWRLRSRADRREPQSPQTSECLETSELKRPLHHKQYQASQPARHGSASSSPSRDIIAPEKGDVADGGGKRDDAVRGGGSPAPAVGASASEKEGEPLQAEAEDEYPIRRTRSSTAVEKAERSAAAGAAIGSAGNNRVDFAIAARAAGDAEPAGNEGAEDGEREMSDGSQDENSSEGEPEPCLDPFAAAALTPRFAAALRLFSHIQEKDSTTLPVSVSALQHLQHTTRGCCCNRQLQHCASGSPPDAEAEALVPDASLFNSSSSSKVEVCNCGAHGSTNANGCLCVRAARKDAASALRGLLVFGGHNQTGTLLHRAPFRCLAPHICCPEAEVESLSLGDPSWLNRLIRPSRKRRPLQPRRASRDADTSEPDTSQTRQQAVSLAARLQHAQQQHSQLQLGHQKQVQRQRRLDEARHQPAISISPAATATRGAGQCPPRAVQPHLAVRTQQPLPGISMPPQQQHSAVSSATVRSLLQLLQAAQQQQQQQQHVQTSRAGDIAFHHLQLQQQLLLQQERAAAALQAAHAGRHGPTAATGSTFDVSRAAETSARIAQQMAALRTSQAISSPQHSASPRIEQQLERQLQELQHQQRLQYRLRELRQQAEQAPPTQKPLGASSLQQPQHQEQLFELLQKAQHDVHGEQCLRQRVLRLQQLQRQLLLLQQQQQQQGDTSHKGQR